MEELNNLFDDHLFDLDKVKEKTLKLKDGERRMVSVLFADIKGFTNLSEKLDHEEVQSLMDHIMKIFSNSVEVHGGYVDKYTGDQIMALFGAKMASEVDTQRSLSTAIDMINKLKKFNQIATNSNKFHNVDISLSIRVGVNTGMVTTGKIGKKREGDFTVYGDAVNLAARMESNAPVGSIMIPEETMHLVKDYFNFTDHGKITVKGKSKPISVYLVNSQKDFTASHKSPFIGRDDELNELSTVYDKCIKDLKDNTISKVSFVGVRADAGIGKSRLIYEFIQNQTCYYSIGSCTNISSKPFHLFSTIIKDNLNISIIDTQNTINDKFISGMNNLIEINPLRKDDLISAKPFLGMLIGIKIQDERLGNKEEFVNHMHTSLRTFIECACTKSNRSEKPFILILEDMHWIDKMSYNALKFILDTLNLKTKRGEDDLSLPIIITTYRNEYSIEDKLIEITNFTNLQLNHLTKESSHELINLLSTKANIPTKKKKELYSKSQGNPFFIEEWINLYNDNDKSTEATTDFDIPDSLNSLILSRIDSLEKDIKSILQTATVMGEDFFLKMLELLESKLGNSQDIKNPIKNLENENFIQEFIQEPEHYKFKHILTRDVSYNTILKTNKKILHNAAAEVIEENFTDSIDNFLYDLAIHYDLSDNYTKAITYLKKAGDNFDALFDKSKALDCYKRIKEIIDNHNETIKTNNKDDIYHDAYLKSIFINIDFGNLDYALKELNSYRPLNESKSGHKESLLGRVYTLQKNIPSALEHYQHAKDIYQKLNETENLYKNMKGIGVALYSGGKYDESLELLNKSLEYFTSTNNNIYKIDTLGNIGSVFLAQGEVQKAYKIFDNQYKAAVEHDAKNSIKNALGNTANITNISGKHDDALKIFNQLISVCEDLNDKDGLSKTYNNIGLCNKLLHRYDDAMTNYKQSLEISKQVGDKGEIAFGYMNMGLVYHKLSNFEESLRNYKKSSSLAKEANDIRVLSFLHGNFGILYTDMGDLDHALEEYYSAQKIFDSVSEVRGTALVNYEISKVLLFKDEYIKAIPLLNKATKTLKELGDTPYWTKSMLTLSMCHRLDESYDDSRKTIKELELNSKIMTNYNKQRIEIEKQILNLAISNENSKNTLIKLADSSEFKANKAYIYYHIWLYTGDNEYKNLASSIFTTLHKKKPKYRFTYFTNKLN